MTVQNLFDDALALIAVESADAENYSPFAIRHVNALLADLYEIENSLRASKGLAELTVMPTVAALPDALTYQDELTRNVMPYGLIMRLVLNEDNASIGYFNQRYEDGKSRYNVCSSSTITDVYSDIEV